MKIKRDQINLIIKKILSEDMRTVDGLYPTTSDLVKSGFNNAMLTKGILGDEQLSKDIALSIAGFTPAGVAIDVNDLKNGLKEIYNSGGDEGKMNASLAGIGFILPGAGDFLVRMYKRLRGIPVDKIDDVIDASVEATKKSNPKKFSTATLRSYKDDALYRTVHMLQDVDAKRIGPINYKLEGELDGNSASYLNIVYPESGSPKGIDLQLLYLDKNKKNAHIISYNQDPERFNKIFDDNPGILEKVSEDLTGKRLMIKAEKDELAKKYKDKIAGSEFDPSTHTEFSNIKPEFKRHSMGAGSPVRSSFFKIDPSVLGELFSDFPNINFSSVKKANGENLKVGATGSPGSGKRVYGFDLSKQGGIDASKLEIPALGSSDDGISKYIQGSTISGIYRTAEGNNKFRTYIGIKFKDDAQPVSELFDVSSQSQQKTIASFLNYMPELVSELEDLTGKSIISLKEIKKLNKIILESRNKSKNIAKIKMYDMFFK